MDFSEKRIHSRYDNVTINYTMKLANIIYKGIVDNISIGGCFLSIINKPLPEDSTNLTAELAIRNDHRAINISGKIVHITDIG